MMKTRILLIALALIGAALFTTSCTKADFLEGTIWTYHEEGDLDMTLVFVNKLECRMFIPSEGITILGDYTVKGNRINIRCYNGGDTTGTISGNTMKLRLVDSTTIGTFKKKI
ncbi:MAG: hypothetical protein IKP46_08275 [Bacteroidales bacterium]|nr:hypothetical protein [Bacteroidales bacterium]